MKKLTIYKIESGQTFNNFKEALEKETIEKLKIVLDPHYHGNNDNHTDTIANYIFNHYYEIENIMIEFETKRILRRGR